MTEFIKVFTSYNVWAFNVEVLFILDVALILFIGLYLWFYDGSWITFQKRPGVRLAMAFGIYFIGVTILRGWSTFLYWAVQRDYDTSLMADTHRLDMIGIVIAVIGAAFAIRVLTQSNVTWILTIIVAVLFGIYVQAGVGL